MLIGQQLHTRPLAPKPIALPKLPRAETKQLPGGDVAMTLKIVAIASLLCAITVLLFAKSAVHEIEAGIAFLCFIAALSGATIIDLLRRR